MKHIFLDFDRTLFDTDRFYTELEKTAVIRDFQIKDIDLTTFLYPDVISFLKICQNTGWKCHLVTFGVRIVQEPKFLGCDISKYFTETFYVESGSKVAVIEKAIGNSVPHENIFFIDDTIEHLKAFNEALPNAKAIRMARPNAKGSEIVDSKFVTVNSLEQLKTIVSC